MTGTHGSEGAPAGKPAGATRLGHGILGGAAPPAGHRLGLLQLFLIRGQQPLDHPRSAPSMLGGDPVDARQHLGQQRGVLSGEELRALQGFFQLAILRRAAARASWASTLGLRSPAIRWSVMSRPVTPCRPVTTTGQLDRR